MLFLLIRIMPAALAIIFYLALRAVFLFFNFWFWFLILLAILDFVFFFLLNSKTKNRRIFWVFCHSLIFIAVGFAYALLLSRPLFINFFLIGWAVAYWLYLESIFHYFYQTEQVELIDYNHILTYVNLIVFFLLSATLINLNIFLGLAWWWLLLIIFPAGFILIFNRFLPLQIEFKTNLLSAVVLALILTELCGAFLFLPLSFYVSAAALAIAYYLMLSFSVLKFKGELTIRAMIIHSAFALAILAPVLSTAAWF